MLKPRVGDTVIIEGVVDSIPLSGTTFTMNGIHYWTSVISKIIPCEIKVGDTVWWSKNCFITPHCSAFTGYTVLHIHQGPGDVRKWAVVAFAGDIPKSVNYSLLRTTRECAD